ncbi:MAG TPA: hypothetical protein VEX35_01450 [Allosphingosinicella sp.]|nr:hypothetical protein [Allosphingosinicella sp.]
MSNEQEELGLGSRLVIGGIAGFVATMAMTSAMRHLHKRLPGKERYPLPPREIVDRVLDPPAAAAPDFTLIAHFAYGAACGALIAAANPRIDRVSGSIAGGGIWLASYMGWLPAFGILKPATRHPLRRDAVMVGAHLAWGWTAAEAMRELGRDRAAIFADGPARDAPA